MVTRISQGRIVLFIVGAGMFFGLIGPKVQQFESWDEASAPRFIGEVLIQIGVVIGAWIAGQLSPGGKVAQSVSNVMTGTGHGTGSGTPVSPTQEKKP